MDRVPLTALQEIDLSNFVIGENTNTDWLCRECTVLNKLVLPDSMTNIGEMAFSNSPEITIYTHSGTYLEQYCIDYGIKYVVQDTPVNGHNYGEWVTVKEATCTTAGKRWKICSDCGAKVTEVIPATGHNWNERIVKEATCTEAGSRRKECTVCGKVVTEEIPAIGHSWSTEYTVDKEPTCTEEGSESIHCTVCGEKKIDLTRTIEKLDHTYGEWTVTKEATCTEEGSREKVCSECGDKVTETIPAKGHQWNEEYTVDIAPTYTEEGVKSIHCAVCGAQKEGTEESIPMLPKPVSMLTIEGIVDKTYTGKPLTQNLVVTEDGAILVEGIEYEVSYENNVNAGTATVEIKGIDRYTGSIKQKFTIKKASNKITAKNFTKTYSTKAQSFSLGVKISNGTPTYKSNNSKVTVTKAGKVKIKAKFIGKATITITAPATTNYSKTTKKITITVKPTKTALSSVSSPSAGKMKVKWKKNAVGTGYQIQYSTSNKFKSVKNVWITKNSATSKTISKLKKGKKYYVRIRTYKKVGKVKYYSGWSKTKAVKVKK